MASNNLEVTGQREEQTGHHTDSPAMVAGTELPQAVTGLSDTTSRRAPGPRGGLIGEQVDLPGPFHREASQPRFGLEDVRLGTPPPDDKRDSLTVPVYPIPARTSSSESSDGSVPASPTRLREKLASEKRRHSRTKAVLQEERERNAQLIMAYEIEKAQLKEDVGYLTVELIQQLTQVSTLESEKQARDVRIVQLEQRILQLEREVGTAGFERLLAEVDNGNYMYIILECPVIVTKAVSLLHVHNYAWCLK